MALGGFLKSSLESVSHTDMWLVLALIDDLSEKNKAATLVLVLGVTTNVHIPSLLDFIWLLLGTETLLLQPCQEARLKPYCVQDTAQRQEQKNSQTNRQKKRERWRELAIGKATSIVKEHTPGQQRHLKHWQLFPNGLVPCQSHLWSDILWALPSSTSCLPYFHASLGRTDRQDFCRTQEAEKWF